jgi:hypothetical protein
VEELAKETMGDRVVAGFAEEIFSYMGVFRQLAPFIHIVGLEDNPFNRAKSNVAWVEASAAGAVVLAPDWPEWQRPGVQTYTDPEDFERKLKALMLDYTKEEVRGDGRELHWRALESREFIAKNQTLRKTNETRIEILRELAELAELAEAGVAENEGRGSVGEVAGDGAGATGEDDRELAGYGSGAAGVDQPGGGAIPG